MEESKMVLRTEDLVKKYGKRTVVSHVSINVKQGEIVGLLGPNGAGKTTSFYMTVGLSRWQDNGQSPYGGVHLRTTGYLCFCVPFADGILLSGFRVSPFDTTD